METRKSIRAKRRDYNKQNSDRPLTRLSGRCSNLSCTLDMDDLSGLRWDTASKDPTKPTPPVGTGSLFTALRPTPPISGRSTPLSVPPGSLSNPSSKPATPANDSFSNLVSFNSSSATKNLSLQEQQKRLLEQKAKQEEARRKQFETQYGNSDPQFWDNLGSGRSTPVPCDDLTSSNNGHGSLASVDSASKSLAGANVQSHVKALAGSEDEDILAAFNSSAPVDSSSNFPVPRSTIRERHHEDHSSQAGVDLGNRQQKTQLAFEDDDDPFGLSEVKPKPNAAPARSTSATTGDDDVLGLLGRPVSDFPPPDMSTTPEHEDIGESPSTTASYALDNAIAELVDMGFPADRSREALSTTESGTDIQAAVGWLLNQAHSESRQKTKRQGDGIESMQSRSGGRAREPISERRQSGDNRQDANVPAWMRSEQRLESAQRQHDSRSPANGEKDPARIAAELGNNLFKTAGSLWKTGTKKVQQVVNDFNSDSDSSQPKWMWETTSGGDDRPSKAPRRHETPRRDGRGRRRSSATKQEASVTDEALMLESDQSRPPRKPTRPRDIPRNLPSGDSSRDHSPVVPSRLGENRAGPSAPPTILRSQQRQESDPRARLSRQVIEDQSSQAYISPARRKRPVAKPPISESEPDLLKASNTLQPNAHPATTSPGPQPMRASKQSTPIPVRPKAPPRSIPQVSSSSLSTSHQHRQKGTEAFKRGDYSTAHSSYSTALSHLPDGHPVTIIVLSNRALTSLKIGEPKAAISDADNAIAVIGPSKGEAEFINLSNGETNRDMREFFGKALMRKAEALEQMERWADAAKVWREAVEAGHGGSTSIRGRNRCEKAAGITPTAQAAAPPRRPQPAKKSMPIPRKSSAMDDLVGRPALSAASSAEAVTRLRAANAAADRADDEKFALADIVDARLTAWKGGKQDNLRALLGSLDTVLWPEAGWKKVGMSELVLPGKVKIHYMKGIAKVHPDKVSKDCFTRDNRGLNLDYSFQHRLRQSRR